MNKFKVGDKVKVIKKERSSARRSSASRKHSGKIGTVIITRYGNGPTEEVCNLDIEGNSTGGFWNYELKLIGGSKMTKYDTLKQQIEDLDGDSSLKEWDDLLLEIYNGTESDLAYKLTIHTRSNQSTDYCQEIKISYGADDKYCIDFFYKTQCQKLEALKKAYLYLLENSGIPKVDKKKQRIEQLRESVEEAQLTLEGLTRRLEELEG